MLFKEKLPEPDELSRIAESVDSYPVSPERLALKADEMGYGQNVVDFIALFADKQLDRFESRVDFDTRTSELTMLINEERDQPKEPFLSPQD